MVLKHYIKKEKVRVFVTALCLGVIYLATHLCASILLNISNILFVMSAVYIVVGGRDISVMLDYSKHFHTLHIKGGVTN